MEKKKSTYSVYLIVLTDDTALAQLGLHCHQLRKLNAKRCNKITYLSLLQLMNLSKLSEIALDESEKMRTETVRQRDPFV
jgi:hypothetical protein